MEGLRYYDSPIGYLLLKSEEEYLTGLYFVEEKTEEEVDSLVLV